MTIFIWGMQLGNLARHQWWDSAKPLLKILEEFAKQVIKIMESMLWDVLVVPLEYTGRTLGFNGTSVKNY